MDNHMLVAAEVVLAPLGLPAAVQLNMTTYTTAGERALLPLFPVL
jgi:hypothetical protein